MYDAREVLAEVIAELDELFQWHCPISGGTMSRARQVIAHGAKSKFETMTRAQQQHCCFMGFDPDNPDVPLD
jgi:hypothetical protein